MVCHDLTIVTSVYLVTKGMLNCAGITTSELVDLYGVSSDRYMLCRRHVIEVLADLRSDRHELLDWHWYGGGKYLVQETLGSSLIFEGEGIPKLAKWRK